jgi:periplasmic protein TonB
MDLVRMHYGTELALARDRDIRVPSLFIAASVILHVMMAVAIPGARGNAELLPPPLQVTLEKREPPPVTPPKPIPVSPVPPPERQKPPPPKKVVQPQPRKPAAPPPAPPPVLALPETPSAPAVSIPVPPVEEKPPATAREEKPAPAPPVASAPPAPPSSAPAKTTAPISDAAYLQNPQPRYPISARRRGEQGTVVLNVLVTREGTAANVNVETSSGSRTLDEAALEAVRKWRFVPAKRGVQPVEAWHLVPIVFRLEGTS